MKNKCPECNSLNTTRFQWVDGYDFEYWICWNCNRLFNITNEMIYKYIWGNNSKRITMKNRECIILAVLKMNSVIIEFLDNAQQECISRRALRKAH